MTIKEKLSALRAIMERESLDAYIISGTDPHNSEYLPAAWKQRQWISGFTGSFGTVVVLKMKPDFGQIPVILYRRKTTEGFGNTDA